MGLIQRNDEDSVTKVLAEPFAFAIPRQGSIPSLCSFL